MAYTEEIVLGRTPGTKEYSSIVSWVSSFPLKLSKKLLLFPIYLLGTIFLVGFIPIMFLVGIRYFGIKDSAHYVYTITYDSLLSWYDLLFNWKGE